VINDPCSDAAEDTPNGMFLRSVNATTTALSQVPFYDERAPTAMSVWLPKSTTGPRRCDCWARSSESATACARRSALDDLIQMNSNASQPLPAGQYVVTPGDRMGRTSPKGWSSYFGVGSEPTSTSQRH
jgi:hypothetical protein